MKSEVRFGVIGCGGIAVATCQGISTAPNASVAMLMDTRPEVLTDLTEFYSVPSTTDLDELLANPNVDAVYVSTPHITHSEIGVKAARAGKHVLMEKPMSTTLADADALIAACKEAGVKLGIGYYGSVDAGSRAARDLVLGGALGEITSVRFAVEADKPAHYWRAGYLQRVTTDWRTRKELSGGGILIMNVSHDLNTVRYVTGLEVKRVYAEADTLATPVEVEDVIGVVMRYENGAIGTVHAGSAMRGGPYEDYGGPRIYGTKGQIILGASGTQQKPMAFLESPPEGGRANTWYQVSVVGEMGDRQQVIEGFAAAVLNDTEPPVTGDDGRHVLQIVLAAYQSAETGLPVEL